MEHFSYWIPVQACTSNQEVAKWIALFVITLIACLLQKQRDALGLFEVNDDDIQFFESSNKEENIQLLLHTIRVYRSDGLEIRLLWINSKPRRRDCPIEVRYRYSQIYIPRCY